MATTTKLSMKFMTSDGKKTISINHANEDADSSSVKSLCEAIVANGDIYNSKPISVESAEFVKQVTSPVDLDNA